MPLAENAGAIAALKAELEPRILGQQKRGSSCGCGKYHLADGTATAVQPAGIKFPGQEADWYLWTVLMTPNPGASGTAYSTGLSSFIDSDELKAMFRRYFGDQVDR